LASAPRAPLGDRARLSATIDNINRQYGKNALYFASAHGALDHAPMRIAFNRIPDIETER
jgi:DNA polymerase-4